MQIFLSSILLMMLTAMDQRSIDRTTVSNFDIDQYVGLWYEIARFDTRFERDLECVTACYTFEDDGSIGVLNRGYNTKKREWQHSEGKAKLTDESGRLRVSFFMNFYSDYNILDLDKNYEWALVGSKSPDFLWVLSRKKVLPKATYDYIVSLAHDRGYMVDNLRLVSQVGMAYKDKSL